MEELIRLDQEETAILMVTYDSRPASNCDKILYLPDGRIAAKLPLGRLAAEDEKQRDKKVAGWLMGMGW